MPCGDVTELQHWRRRAGQLLLAQVPPEHADWSTSLAMSLPAGSQTAALWEAGSKGEVGPAPAPPIPKRFIDMAEKVLCHTDNGRQALLYAAAWRLTHGEAHLLQLAHDPLVRRLSVFEKAVRREIHKAHAFVRFTRFEALGEGPEAAGENPAARYVAWFEPSFSIMRLIAPFFRKRFCNMRWTILSPSECISWDGEHLQVTPGIDKPKVADEDLIGTAWKTYYANIFNPARLKIDAMKREMAVRYWKNLPETQLIANLVAAAPVRAQEMVARARSAVAADRKALAPDSAPAPISVTASAHDCRRCPHAVNATQAVLGEGPATANIMLVGEQPGDREDLEGRPFVGPAGAVLNQALAAAGSPRSALYLTNAVKHFSWELRGKRRLHKTPGQKAILACRDFLLRELAAVDPDVIVCLGRTALTAVTAGTNLSIERGVPMKLPNGKWLLATYHPAFLLRQSANRSELFDQFAAHLSIAAHLAKQRSMSSKVM